MANYTIKLFSKDQKSLKRFQRLIKQINGNLNLKKFCLLTITRIKKQKTKLAILKSPHVNKKAQEQFQLIIYKMLIAWSVWETKKSLIILKKIKNQLFPSTEIKIKKAQFSAKKNLKIDLSVPLNSFFNSNIRDSFKKNFLLLTSNKPSKKKYLLKNASTFLKILNTCGKF